ncbi:hypothetical protein LTR05_004158 [Lithohypha guttulata]|uniref:Uncharacterized protein n=1 Tax=Lithohypha guttulata TaxID=1690604 RepID=A0AAN7T2D3_9EURO|nr:hypothetical protein LTR05_004158 [Lithohypha guttulata]
MQAHLDDMPDSTTTSDDGELEVETSKNSSTTTASDHATSESSASETKTDYDDTSTEAAPSESEAQSGVIVTNTMEQKEASSAAGQSNETTLALSEDVISHSSSLKPEAAIFVFNPRTAAPALNAAALPFFAPLTT